MCAVGTCAPSEQRSQSRITQPWTLSPLNKAFLFIYIYIRFAASITCSNFLFL